MANERPSSRPGGYWLSNSLAGLPPEVWQQWLSQFMGGHEADAAAFPDAPSPYPEGSPSSGPSQFPYSSDFAGNALNRQPSQQHAMFNALRMWGR